MRIPLSLFSLILLSACVSIPRHPGGQRLDMAGVSFVPPAGKEWSMIKNTTYHIILTANGKNSNENFTVAAQVTEIPQFASKEEFLKTVQEQKAAELQTGKFELINNKEFLDDNRPETCVKHMIAYRDYGKKSGEDFTIYETYGMNCIHPNNPKLGILVELSRKAPPEILGPDFENLGENLLRSVQFTNIRHFVTGTRVPKMRAR